MQLKNLAGTVTYYSRSQETRSAVNLPTKQLMNPNEGQPSHTDTATALHPTRPCLL